MPSIAKTVVADASKGDDCFLVDGERFPWWISEEGPSARKLADNLYAIRVTILSFSFASEGPSQPVIDGIEFPWWISEDGIEFTVKNKEVSTATLEFFAEHVEGMDVEDLTPTEKIREVGGRVVAKVDV